jgi:hypothetical protein
MAGERAPGRLAQLGMGGQPGFVIGHGQARHELAVQFGVAEGTVIHRLSGSQVRRNRQSSEHV